MRVHVVGEHTFCTEIDSDGLDYRYATLDAATRWRCSAAAQALGLPFAGLDLMLADDGQTCCFEVNPSPGFSWYEDATSQPIARTLARWLAGRDWPEAATAADHVLPRPTGAISASGTRRRTAGGPERSVVAIRISAENSRYPFLTAFSARQE